MKLLALLLLLQFSLQLTAPLALDHNTTDYIALLNSSNDQSPWINGVMNQELHRRRRGCRFRPRICNLLGERGRRRRRKRCCRNRCINIYSNVNHCGLCRRRCPFGWSCCARRCVDTRFSRRNCGKCFNRCPRRVECYMGMCGYANGVSVSPNVDLPLPDRGQNVSQLGVNKTKIHVDDDGGQQPPDR